MSTWNFLTDFGDTAVTVPLAALMLFFLVAARQLRLALVWGLVVIACAGVTGALKVALAVCGNPFDALGLVNPSGHTAMSAAVYGGFAAVLGPKLPRPARLTAFTLALLLILAIPLSRVALHAHSVTEVAVGLSVGLAAVAMIFTISATQPARLPIFWVLAATLSLIILFHGERWPAEREIHHLAGWLGLFRAWCAA